MLLRLMVCFLPVRIDSVRSLRQATLLLGFLFVLGQASAGVEEDQETKPWQELEVRLPGAPVAENLHPFYVSAASDNQFLVDRSTISVGSDGVVRYVLVVLTADGGRNVTFEGMRCETRERRIYASGRRDGTWSKARNDSWSRIQEVYANRHHAALFLEYFCPGGVIVRDAAEAVDALRRGGHPENKSW